MMTVLYLKERHITDITNIYIKVLKNTKIFILKNILNITDRQYLNILQDKQKKVKQFSTGNHLPKKVI